MRMREEHRFFVWNSRIRGKTRLVLWILLAITAVPHTAWAVQGSWFTEPEEALAAALKEQKPVLAVAMDHG